MSIPEPKNWEEMAKSLGYEPEKDSDGKITASADKVMWVTMYAKHGITPLCQMFGVSPFTVRKKLHEHNIELRKRGGPRYVKLGEMTKELVDRSYTEGVAKLSAETGITPWRFYSRRKLWLGQHPEYKRPELVAATEASETPPAE